MRARFKKWAAPFISENPDISINDATLETSIKFQEILKYDNLVLEIGPGKGKFAIEMAQKFPSLYFLCIEKAESIAAIFAKKVKELDLKNIFIISADIEKVFPMFIKHSISVMFLNHSDPWPKKRHEKRRLTYVSFLDQYKELLKEDGKLIFKTDNIDFFNYSIESLENAKWNIISKDFDYNDSDPFDAITEYETNFRNIGTKINRLIALPPKEKN